MLGRWFDSGAVLTADISSIHTDAVAAELRDPQMVARFTMRRLQALYLIALPGTRTTTDVVVVQVDSILRALLETPSRHLRRASEDVDWDQEWAVLDAGMLTAGFRVSRAGGAAVQGAHRHARVGERSGAWRLRSEDLHLPLTLKGTRAPAPRQVGVPGALRRT